MPLSHCYQAIQRKGTVKMMGNSVVIKPLVAICVVYYLLFLGYYLLLMGGQVSVVNKLEDFQPVTVEFLEVESNLTTSRSPMSVTTVESNLTTSQSASDTVQQSSSSRKKTHQNTPVMITYVFGEEAANLRRLAMWIATTKHTGFDFVIIGDHVPPFELPPNVKHFQISWDALLDRLYDTVFQGKRINAKIMRVAGFRKVCDYKPLAAALFPELVEGYEWWGFLDNDMLLGNLSKFFPPAVLDQYDIINGDGGIYGTRGQMEGVVHNNTWGPFTMFRNKEVINTLYKRVHGTLESLFLHPRYSDFDEWPRTTGRQVPNVTTPRTLETLIQRYQKELGIRSWTATAPSMNDFAHCHMGRATGAGPGCGICNYDHGVLTLNKTGRPNEPDELFLCHLQVSKTLGLEESLLENTTAFELMLKTEKFQAGYDGKFRLLEDVLPVTVEYHEGESNSTASQSASDTGQQSSSSSRKKAHNKTPVMITYVFGEEAANLRRLAMWIATTKYTGFDFVIIGDHVPPFELPPNVKHFQISWNALLDRLYDTVFQGKRSRTKIMRAAGFRKVCDYKPLAAVLFPELVEGYEWWGFLDNDMLLGNLSKFFPPAVLDQHDIINGDGGIYGTRGQMAGTVHNNTWGPFTMFRNTEVINTLYKRVHGTLESLFLHPIYADFDEWPRTVGIEPPNVTTPRTMETLIQRYQKELGIRSWTTTAPSMNDFAHCKMHDATGAGPGCGICNYDHGVLTLNKTGRPNEPDELFLCHLQVSKTLGLEESLLENTTAFELMLKTEKFQAGYDGKFRLLE